MRPVGDCVMRTRYEACVVVVPSAPPAGGAPPFQPTSPLAHAFAVPSLFRIGTAIDAVPDAESLRTLPWISKDPKNGSKNFRCTVPSDWMGIGSPPSRKPTV